MMGIVINVLSVVLGGLLGTVCREWVSKSIVERLNQVFGICAIGMGINSVIVVKNMPPVIMAVVLGTLIGVVLHVGELISSGAGLLRIPIRKLTRGKPHGGELDEESFIAELTVVIMLFCFSCTGIYGSLDAGVTGDSAVLLSKSVLDFFTAMIFACNLGAVVSLVAIPQFVLFSAIYCLAVFIYPFTTPMMIADFKACGGLLLLATGFRVAKIKNFPISDMFPAMILVMPLSSLWTSFVEPLL